MTPPDPWSAASPSRAHFAQREAVQSLHQHVSLPGQQQLQVAHGGAGDRQQEGGVMLTPGSSQH